LIRGPAGSRCNNVTDCGGEVTWEPVRNAAAYVLQIARVDADDPRHRRAGASPPPPQRSGAAASQEEGNDAAGGGKDGDDGGFRTVYRGPDLRFVARGLSPARQYRLRVRAECAGGDGNVSVSRWSFPETDMVTQGRLPLR
jgi:hypothetical protein